jgi:hypothetical protein
MLDILYNMSADAYAKLVAHNNTVVQQFKTYKEAQERALAEAYGRLAALKEFYAKERDEMRGAFEQEKQALLLEKEALLLEKEALLLEKERQSALALERQSALALERQSALALETPSSQEQVMSNIMAGFFSANQN